MRFISIIEAIYIVYMYIFFKTTYSIHSPLEYYLSKNELWKHPINTGKYQNKICKIGSYASIIIAFLFVLRQFTCNTNNKKKCKTIARWILAYWVIVSLLTNLNAFIYMIPIIIVEIYYHKIFDFT
tara:strand:- start:1200 stop:1577 length:378 start_codon:yes stop_codon:yes gene_type:complete